MQGIIKFFNTEKWFGFIVPDDGSADMFVHISACEEGWTPQEGDRVMFEIWTWNDWRSAASNVRLITDDEDAQSEDADDAEPSEEYADAA